MRPPGVRRYGRARVAAEYTEPEPRDTRSSPESFEEGWLPFAEFGSGTRSMLVDLAPRAKGSFGQAMTFTHGPDQIEEVAPSFDQFLGLSSDAVHADVEGFLAID